MKEKPIITDERILVSILELSDTPVEKLNEIMNIDYSNFYSNISKRKILTVKDIILSLSEFYEDVEKSVRSPEEDKKYTGPTIYAFANYLDNPCNREPLIMSLTLEDLLKFYEKYCYEDSEYTIYEYVFDRIERYYKVSEKEFDFKTLRLKDIISLYLNVIDKEYMKTEIEGEDLSVVEEKEKQLTLALMKMLINAISDIYDSNGNIIPEIFEIMKGEN